MWLLAAFILVPLVEIALFIQVGGLIGLWPTLLIVLATAFAGSALVRSQGSRAIADLRRALNGLHDPSEPLAHGAFILLSGALLLTPGFFTDAVGFVLLVPSVRKVAMKEIGRRVRVRQFTYGDPGPNHPGWQNRPERGGRGPIIDAEAEEIEIKTPDPDRRPSGWTRNDSSR